MKIILRSGLDEFDKKYTSYWGWRNWAVASITVGQGLMVMTAVHGANGIVANDPSLRWVVQKFGGTSVGKFPEIIAERVVKPALRDQQVALVCSARSNDSKTEGTTNRLLKAANEALLGDPSYLDIVQDIVLDHRAAAKQHIRNVNILQRLDDEMEYECSRLKDYLKAAQVLEEISPKTKDIIIGTGEKLSCRFIAAVLQDKGIDSQYVSMDHIIPIDYEVKGGLDTSFYLYVAGQMGQALAKCGHHVPVVTGFFGMIPGSLLNQIGRGYTDLCAALVAIGLRAEELQIWKEVDGIFTADPRKVPTARLLPKITPDEAAELTYYGSEVIHPFTMEQVIRERIPIRIKNVENPAGSGTIIFPDDISKSGAETPLHPPKLIQSNNFELFAKPRAPTAVTIKDSIMVINIQSNRKTVSHGFFANIFRTLDKFRVVVDLISTSEVQISMALNAEVQEHDLKPALEELQKMGSIDVLRDMAILSLVGKQMKNMVGVAGKMFGTLAAANINLEMISQGASEINISCVINESDAIKALAVIHQHLLNPVASESPVSSILMNDRPWLTQ